MLQIKINSNKLFVYKKYTGKGGKGIMEKILEEMINLIENQKFNDLREYLKQVNSADFPSLFEELDKEKMILVYRILPKEKAAEVFAELDPDIQEDLINS